MGEVWLGNGLWEEGGEGVFLHSYWDRTRPPAGFQTSFNDFKQTSHCNFDGHAFKTLPSRCCRVCAL